MFGSFKTETYSDKDHSLLNRTYFRFFILATFFQLKTETAFRLKIHLSLKNVQGGRVKYGETISKTPHLLISTEGEAFQPSHREATGLQIFCHHSDILSCITFYIK